jgi:hypothetical protein
MICETSTASNVVVAIGEAVETTNFLDKAAAKSALSGKPFTVSEAVYAMAGMTPDLADMTVLAVPALNAPLKVFQSISVPVPPGRARARERRARITALRRLWSGRTR